MNSPRVSVRIPADVLKDIDQKIQEKHFRNRSDFFNSAATQLLCKIDLEGKP